MITYISRELLEAHPDNPRKDLGDLSELTASISKQDYSRHSYVNDYHWTFKDATEAVRNYLTKQKKNAHVYTVNSWGVTLYKVTENDAKLEAKKAKQEKIAARYRVEQDMAMRFLEKRDAFIREFDVYDSTEEIKRFVLWVMTRTCYMNSIMVNGIYDIEFMCGEEKEPSYTGSLKVTYEHIKELPDRKVWRALLIAAYERISRLDMHMMDRYTGEFKKNELLTGLYDQLQDLGYLMDAEEMDWLGGTHRIYQEG